MGRFLFFVDSSRKRSLHLLELLGIRCGEVFRLAPVDVDVVQLPLVRQRRPFLDPLGHAADPGFARAGRAGEPAVVVDAAAGHDVEELRGARSRRLGVGQGVGHADAGDRVLLEAVHDTRRGDLRQLVDRRHDVDDVVELRPRRRVGLDAPGPGDGQRLAGAAEVGALELRALVGRAAGPGPGRVVHVVGLRAAQRIQAAEFLQCVDVLRDLGRDAILCELLADGAVQPLGRRAVVAPDVEDQGVVELALALDLGDDLSRVDVGVLGEAGEDLHQAALERLLGLGDRVPRRHRSRPWRELTRPAGSSPWPWRARRCARGTCPSRRRTCPCTCRPTPSSPGAARATRPAPST